MHDRQFGGAGIAEQMRDALVLQQCEEGRSPGDAVFHVSSCPRCVDLREAPSWPIGDAEIKWSTVMAALREQIHGIVSRTRCSVQRCSAELRCAIAIGGPILP